MKTPPTPKRPSAVLRSIRTGTMCVCPGCRCVQLPDPGTTEHTCKHCGCEFELTATPPRRTSK